MALAIRSKGSRATSDVGTDVGPRSMLAGYIRTELLDGLSRKDRELLLRTSVLEYLSGPLCDAVLERTGSADRLATTSQPPTCS
jgi:LuxR family maltose regulon positive regulatory protein